MGQLVLSILSISTLSHSNILKNNRNGKKVKNHRNKATEVSTGIPSVLYKMLNIFCAFCAPTFAAKRLWETGFKSKPTSPCNAVHNGGRALISKSLMLLSFSDK